MNPLFQIACPRSLGRADDRSRGHDHRLLSGRFQNRSQRKKVRMARGCSSAFCRRGILRRYSHKRQYKHKRRNLHQRH